MDRRKFIKNAGYGLGLPPLAPTTLLQLRKTPVDPLGMG